jgi:hypothetical protein
VKVMSKPSDGEGALSPHQVAAISELLCRTGLTSPGPVPGGSPKADVVAAVAAAPVAQAQWLSTLLNLVPFPASATSFEVNVTAMKNGQWPRPEGICYSLSNVTGSEAVNVVTIWAKTIDEGVPQAADAIYREVGHYARDVYPRWALWPNALSLEKYREGLACDRITNFDEAMACYSAARDAAPTNMLIRMRMANNADRRSAVPVLPPEEGCYRAIEAIGCYLDVCAFAPTIYQAHYRASVLLGVLADRLEVWGERATPEKDALPTSEQQDLGDMQERVSISLRKLLIAQRSSVTSTTDVGGVITAARHQAGDLSRQAGRLLRPWWTLVHEVRLRNRYELKGSLRREARKARAISKLCLALRKQQFDGTPGGVPWGVPGLWRLLLRLWIRWRHFFLRWGTAGWQAHYNAACFYALMPEAVGIDGSAYWPDTAWLRRRALKHLLRAVSEADDQLQTRYVRYADPDLAALRSARDWSPMMDSLYGSEVVVHYRRRASSDYARSELRVWGPAVGEFTSVPVSLSPVTVTADEAVFLAPIRNWDQTVWLEASNNGERDVTTDCLVAQSGPRDIWIIGRSLEPVAIDGELLRNGR